MLIGALILANLLLVSANVIVTFSLWVYILTRRVRGIRHPIVTAYLALMLTLTATYAGEIFHISAGTLDVGLFWLRMQWLGVAFLPATFLWFADALLRTTGDVSVWRRRLIYAGHGVGVLLALAALTDWLMARPVEVPWGVHFAPGPLYPLFVLYLIGTMSWGIFLVVRAHNRLLTPTAQRRMHRLLWVLIPCAVAGLPYLIVSYLLNVLPPALLTTFPIVAHAGVSILVVLITYIVAYHGVMIPDRVIKQSLILYLLRGPFLGVSVVALVLFTSNAGRLLGVDTARAQLFIVIAAIVLLQIAIEKARPLIDLWVYRGDREEIRWFQEINQRLLTPSDLKDLLESTLAAVCEALRVETGYIAVPEDEGNGFAILAVFGAAESPEEFVARPEVRDFLRRVRQLRDLNQWNLEEMETWGFHRENDHLLFPLQFRGEGETVLGFLCVQGGRSIETLTQEQKRLVGFLLDQVGVALESSQLQSGIVAMLQRVASNIEWVQRWSSKLKYASPLTIAEIEAEPAYDRDEFQRQVKDALDHYWGGPKLAQSPLLQLRIVQAAQQTSRRPPTQALRQVIAQAVEMLRPEGDERSASPEWLLYNISKMRFLQGKRVKEIVNELYLSESDYYRKQRAAIEEVARVLAMMEEEERGSIGQ
jgi:hypothetical protein